MLMAGSVLRRPGGRQALRLRSSLIVLRRRAALESGSGLIGLMWLIGPFGYPALVAVVRVAIGFLRSAARSTRCVADQLDRVGGLESWISAIGFDPESSPPEAVSVGSARRGADRFDRTVGLESWISAIGFDLEFSSLGAFSAGSTRWPCDRLDRTAGLESWIPVIGFDSGFSAPASFSARSTRRLSDCLDRVGGL